MTVPRPLLLLLVFVSVVPVVVGCGGAATDAPDNRAASSNGDRAATPAVSNRSADAAGTELPSALQAGKVELRRGEGEELYSFKPKGVAAAKFYDAAGQELCKLTLSPGRLKIKNADDQPLFELKRKEHKVMIKDASGETELFKFKLKGENIDVYLPDDKRLYRIRHKEYGYALEDNADNTLFRAKRKDGRIVLRDAEDRTVLYSNDLQEPLGLLFFGMQELSTEQQAACLVFFLLPGN